MNVYLLCLHVVLSCVGRGLCDGLITRPESPTVCLSACVITKHQCRGRKGPSWAAEPQEGRNDILHITQMFFVMGSSFSYTRNARIKNNIHVFHDRQLNIYCPFSIVNVQPSITELTPMCSRIRSAHLDHHQWTLQPNKNGTMRMPPLPLTANNTKPIFFPCHSHSFSYFAHFWSLFSLFLSPCLVISLYCCHPHISR
jgi:hypothetical protein